MFHKIKTVVPLPNFNLKVRFMEGLTKIYDIKPLIDEWEMFKIFETDPEFFKEVKVDQGGYGIVWSDDLDLACDELFFNGKTIKTPFDGLISFSDATQLWGLNESTLRKAISYGKLVEEEDACKFGSQWLVSKDAMEREYGSLK